MPPKIVDELTDVQVRRLTWGAVQSEKKARKRKVGDPCTAYHAVGGVSGLLLQCRPPMPGQSAGARSWVLRTKVGDKRRDIGLGGYPDVTLSMARQKARDLKEKIRSGIDPVLERRATRSALQAEQAKQIAFVQVAEEYIAKKSKEFKTAKQVQKLTNHMKNYVYPYLGTLVVSDIELAHIERMLKPVWETKTETASRVRMHVERILDLAGVKGLRSGDNPARWKGNLELSFPARHKVAKTEHYAALPVKNMPSFYSKLVEADWMGAYSLRFIILTAARSGEVRGATWEEIDFDSKLWIVPASRMKNGKTHKVPLCESAITLVENMPRQGVYIFPNSRGNMLSDATISKAPKRLGFDVTAHGFRATFRTWAQDFTSYADDVVELALAHVNSDATRAAYARSELIDKRRLLMAEWERFCLEGEAIAL